MFRVGAQRVVRPLAFNHASTSRIVQQAARLSLKTTAKENSLISHCVKPLSLTAYRANAALSRSYATVPGTTRATGAEEKARSGTVESAPDLVSTQSSVHLAFSEVGVEAQEQDTDMMAGVRHDMKVIKDTFALDEVPKEALNIGLAGVLPYLATSAATVFCAFEMNTAAKYGSGWLFNEAGAESALHFLEPLQVGYGAVILSCLGTIHWGLEWAGYGGTVGYRRYAIGVLAPAVAWPTILMPVEYALISQFLAFNLLYAVDSSTTTRGWTPPWYGTYRFILTFIVGAAIVVSLIGRGQIQDRIGNLPTATDRFKELQAIGFAGSKGDEKSQDEEEEERSNGRDAAQKAMVRFKDVVSKAAQAYSSIGKPSQFLRIGPAMAMACSCRRAPVKSGETQLPIAEVSLASPTRTRRPRLQLTAHSANLHASTRQTETIGSPTMSPQARLRNARLTLSDPFDTLVALSASPSTSSASNASPSLAHTLLYPASIGIATARRRRSLPGHAP